MPASSARSASEDDSCDRSVPEDSEGSSDEGEAFESLRHILESQTHLFTCGGVIPIRGLEEPSKSPSSGGEVPQGDAPPSPQPDEQRKSNPITIRWDTDLAADDQATHCAKLTLPLDPGAEADLDRLVRNSQPATFGLGGQDVYDESYRKALKMDTTAFCTTFDPYSLGIIDAIAQVLLPSVIDSNTHRAVHAELYKLNVYSAPSGRFKPHVDTPRSRNQFGSLVVCLPVEHEGGQLKVRHEGKEMTFDWSTSRDDSDHAGIRWAAFYSDCEHEVLEVTSGHRVTLTYNLYAVRGVGRLTGVSPTLDPTHLPLYQAIEAMLGKDPFGGQGGVLGFWCSHVYAYNHKTETPLPDTLKGVDAVLWESFQALGLETKIAPVIELDDYQREWYLEWYEKPPPPRRDPWGAIEKEYEMPAELPSKWVIGRGFGVYRDDGLEIDTLEQFHHLYESWGDFSPHRIRWLTRPGKSDMQLLYTAYGNQASVGTIYSSCAILVNIKPST